MAAVVGSLLVELQADSILLSRALAAAGLDINRFESRTGRSLSTMDRQFQARFASMSRSVGGLSKAAKASLGALAVGAVSNVTLRSFADLSDSATKIRNSLRSAGLSGDELTDTYGRLYRAAQENAAPIESLATLYGRVAINQKELGASSAQLIGLTTNVAKALKAQGSNAEEASGALLQLSQALGSGKVQAEEYNSLIDGMPVLLQAAAAGIKQANGSVAELTRLVKAGEISSKALFDGIAAGAGVIDQRLSGSAETVGQAMTRINNALTDAAGRFSEASGASAAFGNILDRVVRYIDGVNFDNVADQLAKLITIMETATTALSNLFAAGNQVAGIDVSKLADSIIPKDGESTADYLHRAVYGTSAADDQAKANAQERLRIEQRIAELKSAPDQNSPLIQRDLKLEQAALDGLNASKKEFEQPPHPMTPTPRRPMQGPERPKFTLEPIDITSPEYKPPATAKTGTGKSRGTRATADDRFNADLQSIRDRAEALKQEAATIGLSFQEQVKRQTALQLEQQALADLREEARRKGATDLESIRLSPDKVAAIQKEAAAYAEQAAQLRNVEDRQQRAEAAAEDFYGTFKESAIGAITGANSFGDALVALGKKLQDLLLNAAFDSFLKPATSSSSGGIFGGLFSGIGKLLGFDQGGYTGPGGRLQAAGIVHRGEYVMSKRAVDRVGAGNFETIHRMALKGYADGGAVGLGRAQALSIPSIDASRTVDRMQAGAMEIRVAVDVGVDESGNLQPFVRSVAREESHGAVTQYDRHMPDRVQQINRNPRRR
ncbi:tape measure protein [Rhizobium sp. Rhizsp82]|uniref:tape measure protein n=1 Tax=Rhizobium sp. Rhizsp82 TaxID=3243057 RepID=UPI0039B50824